MMTSPSPQYPVKERILECALQLFAARGYNATSVREVAEAAGITKPTLYYYFGSKEGLFRAIFLGYQDAFFSEFEKVCTACASLRARLQAIAELHFRWLNEKPLLAAFMYRAIFGILPHQPGLAGDFSSFRGHDTALILKTLSEAAQAGEIPPEAVSEFSAIRFLGHLQAYVGRCAVGFKDPLTPDLAAQVAAGFLDGVHASSGASPAPQTTTKGDPLP